MTITLDFYGFLFRITNLSDVLSSSPIADAKIPKIGIFLLLVEKIKFSEFLLGDKNATYLSSKTIFTLLCMC